MANLMTMQSHAGFPYREPDLDYCTAADMSSLYSTHSGWTPSSAFAVDNTPVTHPHFNLNANFQQERSLNRNNKPSHDPTADAQHAYTDVLSSPAPNLAINTTQQCPTLSVFTPTNPLVDAQNLTTISPMQTRFDHDNASVASGPHLPFGRQFHSPSPSDPIPASPKQQNPCAKRRRDSLQANVSPTASQSSNGRRRRSEYAEPGSARAVYLEKNRKAASKCRSKQKMQQEELVETARDVERRNRALKAEVEFLRGGMRDLMDIVGQHTTCPDGRLRTYVQREADRLASNGRRLANGATHSSSSSPAPNGSP